jgi:hypothetical protein
MQRSLVLVIGAAALTALSFACTKSIEPLSPTLPSTSAGAPADGSTLKATTPAPQSPVNDQRLTTNDRPTLTSGSAKATFGDVPLQYRFQLLTSAGALVSESPLLSATNWLVNRDLEFNTKYTWRVRAEYQGSVGSWSSAASFLTAEGGFIRGSQMFDPLTNGTTVGVRRGGHFVQGRGWMADSLNDGIDYDLATCPSCQLEFDVTNVGRGGGVPIDVKWITMGDAGSFGDFLSFRDHRWKMHLEQRADGDGTGMKIIWRNGGNGAGNEPGDHVALNPPGKFGGVLWNDSVVYHFVLRWSPSGFVVTINGQVWFEDGFGGNAFAPPNFRVSLGCYPRGETMEGAIWSNVKMTQQ